MAVAIVFTAYAHTQLSVICEDSEETFEVNPDSLKISQYNENWLDSIPYLMENERMSIKEAISLIDNYLAPLPKWAVRMKTIFDNQDVDDLEGYIKSLVDLDNDSADELVVSIACLKILRPDTPAITALSPSPEVMGTITLAAKKSQCCLVLLQINIGYYMRIAPMMYRL